MRGSFRIISALALGFPLCAAEYSLDLNPATTKIQWTLGDVLHVVHGTFALKRGSIHFDSETGKASGQVVVDVASGNSGGEARDRRMHASILESANFPDAIFVPDQVEGSAIANGSSSFKVHGLLTIHGAPHPITMNVQSMNEADHLHTEITFDVPYVAWGMKDPSNLILKVNKSVAVKVECSAALQKQAGSSR